MKYSDYFKKKRSRETRKRIVSAIAAVVVFVTTYSLILPAITLDVSRAGREPGVAFEQMQFRATASAASVTAADSTAEEVRVEEDSAEEPTEEETVEEDIIGNSEGKSSAASDNQEQKEAAALSERRKLRKLRPNLIRKKNRLQRPEKPKKFGETKVLAARLMRLLLPCLNPPMHRLRILRRRRTGLRLTRLRLTGPMPG